MNESPLNDALRHFEAAEANLLKLEKVLAEIESAIPEGVAFGGDEPEYENNCRSFYDLLKSLPKLDGWKPVIHLMGLDEIAQSRLDALEIGEVHCQVSLERDIRAPARLLRQYRYRFDQKRRELIRESIMDLSDSINGNLRELAKDLECASDFSKPAQSSAFVELKSRVKQIDTLLGSSVPRPGGWSNLHRHLHFGLLGDLQDIIEHDWPSVNTSLRKSLYGDKEPSPVEVEDLGTLVQAKPKGPVATKLKWETLSEEEFERLIFALISSEPGYENPEWLMKTNAPDRGRDLSVYRVYADPLGGTRRSRVIIQCKHWLSKSIGPADIATPREQIKLWEPPIIDVCVFATSGRFTSDAVALIERQNHSDSALRIEMWPESHLERLLASRPALIAEFSLR